MSLLDPEWADFVKKEDSEFFKGSRAILLDVMHHDVPERHVIGGTLLAPNLVRPIASPSSVGRSPAVAREDHQHGAGGVAKGLLAAFVPLTNPIVVPITTATNLSNSLTFTPTLSRYYRLYVIIRAIGPAVSGTLTQCSIRLAGTGVPNLDHWWSGSTQWDSMTCSVGFTGDGASKTWTIQAANAAQITHVYLTEAYISDEGGT